MRRFALESKPRHQPAPGLRGSALAQWSSNMHNRCLIIAAISLSLCLLHNAASQEKKTDSDRIQGSWKIVKVDVEGKAPPAEFVEKGKFVFKGNKVSIYQGDAVMEEATFALDTTKKPPTIDLTATAGPGKGKVAYGIYRIEGDKLTLCIGDKRPSEFKAQGEVGVLQLKRVKSEK
jgi:uncharacterized protein (TIGR03067 family)